MSTVLILICKLSKAFSLKSNTLLFFTAVIKKFEQKGEKTGWTYIEISEKIAQQLMPGNKKAFRVKGTLDNYVFEGVSLIPMGDGFFIMALNAEMRKHIRKPVGALLDVKIAPDTRPIEISIELLECLSDEPQAMTYFKSLPPSHQKYFSNWIESAKTAPTKAKRIAATVKACTRKQHYGEMIRSLKQS